MRIRMVSLISIAFFLPVSISLAQSTATKDLQAVSLLKASVSALANGVNITNATLIGTVTRTAGSDTETGAVTMKALGGVDGSISLTLGNSPLNEVINQSQGASGQWSGPDGALHATAQHNSFIPANWFFPALALAKALNDPSIQVAYVGQETRNNVAVEHIRFWRVIPSGMVDAAATKLFEHLTSADVYLASGNALPVALVFDIHPDNNELVDIPVEIRYSDYQEINGVLLPEHIRKFINNSLLLDIYISGAEFNTNLTSSDFATTTASR